MGGKQIAENIGGWMAIIFGGLFLLLGIFPFFFVTAYTGFPIWKYALLGIIVILIIIFRKRIFSGARDKRDKPLSLFSLKTFIIYGITFTIGYWVSTIILPYIKLSNLIALYLLTGLCLELSAKICQMFLYKKLKITIDKMFILWILIHSVVAYSIVYLINKFAIQNQYLFLLAVGFGIALVTNIIWRVLYKN